MRSQPGSRHDEDCAPFSSLLARHRVLGYRRTRPRRQQHAYLSIAYARSDSAYDFDDNNAPNAMNWKISRINPTHGLVGLRPSGVRHGNFARPTREITDPERARTTRCP